MVPMHFLGWRGSKTLKCRAGIIIILAQLVEHAQKGTIWFGGSFSTVNLVHSEYKNQGCHRKLYFFRLSELTNLGFLYEIDPKLYHPSVSVKKKWQDNFKADANFDKTG